MSDPKAQALIIRLDDAARRWWVPRWLSDLLTQASAHIEVQAEMEVLMQMKLDRARDVARV